MKQKINLLSAGAIHFALCVLFDRLLPDLGVSLAIAPVVAAALIGAGGSILGGVLGKKKKTSQGVLETPEQKAARQKLGSFGATGKIGGFTVGEDIGIGGGDFNASGIETKGLSRLQDLLDSGLPESFDLGKESLKDFLATSDSAIDDQFNAFKTTANRQIQDSVDATKRNQAFAGNLFSTDTFERLGDVQARGNETLIAQLAGLTDSERSRRLSATGLAFEAGSAEQNAELGQIQASQQFGDLMRQLNDQEIQRRDAEILRRRGETGLQLDALSSVAGTPSNFGIGSVSTSPYADLISMTSKLGGDAITNYLRTLGKKPKITSTPPITPTQTGPDQGRTA